MSTPLIEPNRADNIGDDDLFAVERRETTVRDTAIHQHATGQLIGSLSGLLSIRTLTGAWVVPATHAIWMPPRTEHAMRSHGTFAGWSVYVGEGACAGLRDHPATLRTSRLLREAVHRAASWNHPPQATHERRIAAVILDEIASLAAIPLSLVLPTDPRLRSIVDRLLADPTDERTIADWSRLAGMSPRTLARRFMAETGMNLTRWRQRALCIHTIERLADGQSVTTIAIDLGYSNVGAFIAMFRRVTGQTPARYARLQPDRVDD
ncbi:AraC family transcriptional regulator [Pararhizobium mangrovi]|uniref:Helix-turn-helix transcriptional regulator n=1 Tax=Pararhizobium mangrovi TaxID=2590452 RepID=A0A506U3Z0_9HYPH|nr:helix-turn-helix transcriptional regulator [Pararhizobium mangrovi]TPW27725.1 helix-turn-helix transcriptional regulator [Pararhizobium mangrovi]